MTSYNLPYNPFNFSSAISSSVYNDYLKKSVYKDNADNPYKNGRDYFRRMSKQYSMPSGPTFNVSDPSKTLDARMLVIPIVFKDSPSSDIFINNDENREKLNKVFFGNSQDTAYWESVSSFYNKSSYGKINITGEIAPYLDLDYSVTDYMSRYTSGEMYKSILQKAYVTYFLGDDPIYKISDFDSDGDNVIDYVWLVYMQEYYSNSRYYQFVSDSSSYLWAVTSWSSNIEHINNFSYASFGFMFDGTTRNGIQLDAHTFIHETGHQMGLDDYYSYDDEAAEFGRTYVPKSPMGRLDMMDSNILDHCSFSKYNLGWIDPIIGKTGSTYTLKPFQENGDAIILAADFNGTCYDEYYIAEYYTPKGLNELDTKYNYNNITNIQGVNANGLRILHVCQKLSLSFTTDGGKSYKVEPISYDNPEPSTKSTEHYFINTSNTGKYSQAGSSYNLVELVQASGETYLQYAHNATHAQLKSNYQTYEVASDLFVPYSEIKKNNIFGKDVGTSSYEGWSLPFQVNISQMDDNGITFTLNPKGTTIPTSSSN